MMRASKIPICLLSDRRCPSFLSFTPLSVLFFLPSVCPALVLLSFFHFIVPAWLNSNTGPLSVSLLLSLSHFCHSLSSSSSASKIFNICNHVRVFDASGKHPPPHFSFPSLTFVQPLPYLRGLELRSSMALQLVPQTQQRVGPYQRRQRTCGNEEWGIRNSKINVEENTFSFQIQALGHWETLNDARERDMRIKLMNRWITEGKDKKQRRALLLDWDKPQCGTSVYIYLYILHVIKLNLYTAGTVEENGIKQAQCLYELCCSFGFGSVMLKFVCFLIFSFFFTKRSKGQRVTDQETMICESVEMWQWKKEEDFACRDGQIHIGVGPRGHSRARVGPRGHHWAWVVGQAFWKNLFECWIWSLHQWGRALLVSSSCWTWIITQQPMCAWIHHLVGDCWRKAIRIAIDLCPTACVNLKGRRPLSLVAHVSQKYVIKTGWIIEGKEFGICLHDYIGNYWRTCTFHTDLCVSCKLLWFDSYTFFVLCVG